MRKGGGVAARGEGSVDVGGREREEAEAAGFPARRSQFRPGIYPINFCSVEWQRARQFGSASAILTLYRNSAGHEEAARAFPPLLADPTAIIVDRPPPPPPTIISLSPSTEIFVVFLSSVPGLRGRIHFRQSFCVLPFIASSIFSAG